MERPCSEPPSAFPAFHANVRMAAKRGVPCTDTIYNDLKERFPGRPPAGPNGGNGGGRVIGVNA
jgi:hypothetical protein